MCDDEAAQALDGAILHATIPEAAEHATAGPRQNYEAYLDSRDWRYESLLPAVLEEVLPLRRLCIDYIQRTDDLDSGRRAFIQPECRIGDEVGSAVCVPRLFNPILSVPVHVNESWLMVQLSSLDGLEGMMETLRVLRTSRKCWYFDDATIVQTEPLPSATLYPLHVFTSIADWETPSHVPREAIWRFLYDGLDTYSRRPGLFGTVHDNSLIDVRPYDMREVGTPRERDIASRRMRDDWGGFIDCAFTTFSLEAGRIRSVVHGCMYRCFTAETYEQAWQLLGEVHKDARVAEQKTWLFRFSSKSVRISDACVTSLLSTWRTFDSRNAPSLDVFEPAKVVLLHAMSGCLLKRVPCLSPSGFAWVDSLCYNTPAMLLLLTGVPRASRANIRDNSRTLFHLFPFFADDEPPRPGLASSICTQAICKPRVELTSTIASTATYLPVVRTPFMQQVIEQLPADRPLSVPGIPLLVVFANMRHNYEDGIVVSKRVNVDGLFPTRSIVYHPVSEGTATMRPGSKITASDTWFRPHCDATVLREGVSKRLSRYVAAEMHSNALQLGDKLATWHGQKFTVTRLVDDSELPLFTCTQTGRRIRPHVVAAASSIHNRGTVGQLYEAWAGMQCVGDVDFDPRTVQAYSVYDPFDVDALPTSRYSCYVSEPGSGKHACVADFGICHFWQLSHVARDKQHYVSEVPRRLSARRGKLKGAGVRFGEMETLSMLSGGLVHCLSYLSDNGDLADVDLCSTCRRLTLHCDCPGEVPPATRARVRNALVKLDILRTNYSVNGYLGLTVHGASDMGEAVEGKYAHIPFIPESFSYT